jgi:hypothetical protein
VGAFKAATSLGRKQLKTHPGFGRKKAGPITWGASVTFEPVQKEATLDRRFQYNRGRCQIQFVVNWQWNRSMERT